MGTLTTNTCAQTGGYTCGEHSLRYHYPQLSNFVLDRLDEPILLSPFEGGDDSHGGQAIDRTA